jgi:hypothetical protein
MPVSHVIHVRQVCCGLSTCPKRHQALQTMGALAVPAYPWALLHTRRSCKRATSRRDTTDLGPGHTAHTGIEIGPLHEHNACARHFHISNHNSCWQELQCWFPVLGMRRWGEDIACRWFSGPITTGAVPASGGGSLDETINHASSITTPLLHGDGVGCNTIDEQRGLL